MALVVNKETITSVIEKASQRLAFLSDSPTLDAQVLLCAVLNKEITYLMTWPEQRLTDNNLEQFTQLLARRLEGEPIAYILGKKEFWSLPFSVAPSTLIPRPDTELLVELVLAHHAQSHLKLLDLGTGTGAIALALASEQPQWKIDAIDFNKEAVELAQKNANDLSLTHVDIYQSDWFLAVDKRKVFDVIVSNPPYIDEADEHLSQGDVRFEPLSALIAANSGLADIEHIAVQAKSYLRANGRIYFEHGYQQGDMVRKLLITLGYVNVETVKDFASNDRVTWAKLSK